MVIAVLLGISVVGMNGSIAAFWTAHAQSIVPIATTITPSYLPDAVVDTPYSATLTLTAQGMALVSSSIPWSWSMNSISSSSESMPPGLSIVVPAPTASSTNTGNITAAISGVPTAVGTFTFTVEAADSDPNYASATETYTLNVDENTTGLITPTTTPAPVPMPAITPTIPTYVTTTITTSDLEAELSDLENELMQLEAETGGLGGSSAGVMPNIPTTPSSAGSVGAFFSRDLTVGDTGPDVQALQEFLNQNNFPVAQTGPGSPGNETQYFGTETQSALAAWQTANNVSPASGYYGPITRGMIGGAVQGYGNGTATTTVTGNGNAPMIPAPSNNVPTY